MKIFFVLISAFTVMQAEVRLAAIFSSNMVLQRNCTVPVWGFAAPQETVSVSFNAQQQRTAADMSGKWMIKLSPMNEGGPFTMTVKGTNELLLENILIGEVWICSGQSNMSFELKKTSNGPKDVSEALNPLIRLFTVKRAVSETLQTDCKGIWSVCSPEEAGDFTAVGYFFGKALQESLKIPIGLVHDSWAGTAAEGWVPKEVLEGDSDFVPILKRWNSDVAEYPHAIIEWQEQMPKLLEQWKADSITAVAAGKMVPRKPSAPRGPGHRDTPTGQYNGMLYPIIPFAMQGVIWYQGESNASRAYQYRKLFPAMISYWRSVWQQGDFPFYYVQLPNLDRQPEPSKSGWAELRESQLITLSLPNTGMAVTIDVGDPKDLHPVNKRPVGERLAKIALAQTYGNKMEYSGPQLKKFIIDGTKVRLTFDHSENGLVVTGGKKVIGFVIAGKDKIFLPADAEIKGNTITVSHKKIKDPVSVRYAWADNPACNLYNKTGLPASPFRTDDWEEVTFNKK